MGPYQQQQHDGHVDEKHGAPPEVLEQQPAEQGTERATGGEAGDPHTHSNVCSCGSRNMLRINERVEGARVADATPRIARAAISMGAVNENAASTEAAPNATAPISSSRRRPIRSPNVPIVMSDPPTRKP